MLNDLRPDAHVTFHPTCGRFRFDDAVNSYSWRRRFWNRQLVLDHEAFHRRDWDSFYRRELTTAEQALWDHTIPESEASSEQAAVLRERSVLDQFFIDAYTRVCQSYTPQQESRAYDAGALAYQTLVDSIRARAAQA